VAEIVPIAPPAGGTFLAASHIVAIMMKRGDPARTDAASIIIVDAYGHSREGLGTSLRGAGFGVETADSAWQAIAKMKDGRFALAIIDADLPAAAQGGVGAWDLVRVFRAFHAAAPVILIGTEWWRLPAGEPAPEVTYLEKPIDPRAVRALVTSLCGEPRAGADA
jgi:DNA-binding response OmpR family regulator